MQALSSLVHMSCLFFSSEENLVSSIAHILEIRSRGIKYHATICKLNSVYFLRL